MSSKKILKDVFGHLKSTGNIVGTYPSSSTSRASNRDLYVAEDDQEASPIKLRARILKYNSYNPMLTKADFVAALPQTIFSTSEQPSLVSFELIKVRDPRYFQFKDKYELVFPNSKLLKEYERYASFGRINGNRVRFTRSDHQYPQNVYKRYCTNLSAAFESREQYFETIKTPKDTVGAIDNEGILELQQKIRPIEQKSLLIWNFPLDLKPYDICEKYWFYDISHCFKIYWDPETGKTLHYVAFHSERDSVRFKRNFHGAYFNDEHTCKLLVEEL